MAENDATVTTQPSVTTEEAAKTDEVLSPVGDKKVKIPTTPAGPAENDATVRPQRDKIEQPNLDR